MFELVCVHWLFLLGSGAFEPVVITRRAETRIISGAGDETLVVQLGAEIFGVSVSGDLSRIFRCAQKTPNEFVHPDQFRTSNRDNAIHWLGEHDISHGGDDVVRGDGLHHTRRQSDSLPFGS